MAEKSIEEKMEAYEKELKRLQKALDYQEIQNVFARHEYYHTTPTEEINMIFAQKQEDVCFGQNHGFYVGLDSVKKYYRNRTREEQQKQLDALRKWHPDILDDLKYARAGSASFHQLTTPLIEIAEDGETAQGMWSSPGFWTRFDGETGKWQAGWWCRKYAVDFIKEDGKWKIWHLCVCAEFDTPFEKSWVKNSEEQRLAGPRPSTVMEPDKPGIYEAYNTRRVLPPNFPHPPEPYKTFSKTISYGPK